LLPNSAITSRIIEPSDDVHIPARSLVMTAMRDAAAGLTPRGRITHARISGAAADLIYRRGLSNTTLADVRDATSVSGSQLTHYFPDKRALVRGVIALRRKEVVAMHTDGQLGGLDTFAALWKWAELNVRFQLDLNCMGGCVFGSLVGELLPADDELSAELTTVYEEWIGLLRAGLTAMRKRGDLRDDADPKHLARVLVAAHQGGSLLSQTSGSIKPLRDALEAAVRYTCSYATDPVAAADASPGPGAGRGRRSRR
jgi:TetR/AcrR family transcriptional regulator, transcriptional repressor for nem operon